MKIQPVRTLHAGRSRWWTRYNLRGLASPLLVSAALILPAIAAAFARCQDMDRPNVVFILADDLGYRELGCFGQQKIKTPNLDRLAAEGMRLTQHYCGNAVCALALRANDGQASWPCVHSQQPLDGAGRPMADSRQRGDSRGIDAATGLCLRRVW